MRLGEIAAYLGGTLTGDPALEIRGVNGVHDVREGEITFLSDRRLMDLCATGPAAAVVVSEAIPELPTPQVIVGNPLYAFARLLYLFHGRPPADAGISGLAAVAATASLGEGVSVAPFVFIGENAVVGRGTVIHPGAFIGSGTVLGEDCLIYPNVTIRERVTIGNRVIIHPGAVIGADGFGYVFEAGRHYKIPQVGVVEIGDDVEIGANTTIDRATTGSTVIGSGTKIDNLVQVGHNVKIGANSVIVAQVGIGGSTEIGSYVVLGGQVGVSDHAQIADGCRVAAQSGIMGRLEKGTYSGSPVIPHRDWLRATALFAKLPELHRRVRELEERSKNKEGSSHD